MDVRGMNFRGVETSYAVDSPELTFVVRFKMNWTEKRATAFIWSL